MNDEKAVEYVYRSLKAVRGFESRTITHQEKLGWEVVDQKTGTLRTEIQFRKVKRSPLAEIVAAVRNLPIGAKVGIAVLAAIAIIGGVIGAVVDGDKTTDTSAPLTAPTASASITTQDTPSISPSGTPTPSTATTGWPASKLITAENNSDFAAVLKMTDDGGPGYTPFAQNYAGDTVAYDGFVAAIGPSQNASQTAYLIIAGEPNPNIQFGPSFQVNAWPGNHVPSNLHVNERVHVVGVIGTYNEDNGLFRINVYDDGRSDLAVSPRG